MRTSFAALLGASLVTLAFVPLTAQTPAAARPAAPAPSPAAVQPQGAVPAQQPPAAPAPAPPQRGGRGSINGVVGGVLGGIPGGVQQGQQGGRGRGAEPTPAAVGRGFGVGPMENVKIDVVLADSVTQSGGKKTVSMVVTNNRKGQIRSQGNGSNYTLNVDAQPQLLSDGRIFVALDLLYLPEAGAGGDKQVAMINESLSVLVKDGVAMLVSQSADPRSDRKVTVELTASVMK